MCVADIRTWHQNIEQHASENVNKILIGNKCDSDSARQVSVEQGRELADELGLRFLETSAKANEGVEEAFFTLARYVSPPPPLPLLLDSSPSLALLGTRSRLRLTSDHVARGVDRDIKVRLIDTQEQQPAGGPKAAQGNVSVGGGSTTQSGGGCC